MSAELRQCAAMRLQVVHDVPEPCPYLDGRTARLPLEVPLAPLRPETFDAMLEAGYRRIGPAFYRTHCESCDACKPLRVPVATFRPTRSQRRAVRRNTDLIVRVSQPIADHRRLELYNRHSIERGLSLTREPTTLEAYRAAFVHTTVDTREISYFVDDRLAAVSILDVGRRAASSVYHFFDPDESSRSLGVFSVIAEIALCRSWGLRQYYLGLWVQDCPSLAYKATYTPHECRLNGQWVPMAGSTVQRSSPVAISPTRLSSR